MALNASSHNAAGSQTGPTTGQPPPVGSDTKDAILKAAGNEATGQQAPGRESDTTAPKKVKTEKELEKERQKEEKAKKFAEKQAKKAALQQAGESKKAEKKKQQEKNEEQLPTYVEDTPKGQKKILKSLDDAYHKAYIPGVVESAWYDWWEAEGYFQPEFDANDKVKSAGAFTVVWPPPNVTGALHCGHALAGALQDTLVRWNRMKGLTTLFVPGCDHAGISTQSVVENMLFRRRNGQTRHDLGRQKFTELVWDWKEEYHKKINTVEKRLGISFDWTREAFTMSPTLSAAVTETFCRLHEEGYIYRANRLVNWCTKLNTALSNLEVDNKELEGRTLLDVPGYERKVEFGVITHFKYPIEGSSETIEVATTRPETMLGDTGIAVHPKDSRYTSFIGKTATHPLIEGRKLPIIADDYVDPEFGTGAVKLTPAHDPNDFNLGKKHKLKFINILNDDGTLNGNAGTFKGQRRFDARYTVVEALTKLGLFVKKENNPMKVPLCSKSKDVIEPLVKPQWYCAMEELAKPALEVVRNGSIKIRPETAERSYYRWMENVQDWCLSRQLWWGHQVPAYFVKIKGDVNDETVNERWVTGRTEEQAREKAEKLFGKDIELVRDPDVLDTWFSSGLWPFSTLGWPSKTHDLEHLFPTSILETGWDILFFWVARMIFLSLKLTGKVPFNEVYCHSLIRDSEGRKMSKSLGNVIDPVDVMEGIPLAALHEKLHLGNLDPKEIKNAEKYQNTAFPKGIPECGADALRFSLVQYTTGGGDINFDINVMASYRRFCNKIYQATKYVLGKLPEKYEPQPSTKMTGKESLPEKWILHKLTIAAKNINQALTDREFSRSTQIAYQYWYDFLCDVYIENSKTIISEGSQAQQKSAVDTLYTALEGGLTMIHPFMPFLTEELWQRLPRRPGDKTPSIVKAAYPQYDAQMDDPKSEGEYDLLLGCSKGIRSLVADYNVRENAEAYIYTSDKAARDIIHQNTAAIRSLSPKALTSINVLPLNEQPPAGSAAFGVSMHAAVYLDVSKLIKDVGAEITKAQGKMKKAADGAAKQRKIVDAADFKDKVSEAVQDNERQKLQDYLAEQKNYERSIEQFERLKLGS